MLRTSEHVQLSLHKPLNKHKTHILEQRITKVRASKLSVSQMLVIRHCLQVNAKHTQNFGCKLLQLKPILRYTIHVCNNELCISVNETVNYKVYTCTCSPPLPDVDSQGVIIAPLPLFPTLVTLQPAHKHPAQQGERHGGHMQWPAACVQPQLMQQYTLEQAMVDSSHHDHLMYHLHQFRRKGSEVLFTKIRYNLGFHFTGF